MERLPEVERLVERESYFVLHAPRRTGKTTALRELATRLTTSGRYAAVYASCEGAQAAADDYASAERMLLDELRIRAGSDLKGGLLPPPWPSAPAGSQLRSALTSWARSCPRPLVLLLDEIDAILGASLISVLRQLRAGYPDRPDAFPCSVILSGLRDVRDYKLASGGGESSRLGTASPFNIKVESIRLRDFTADEVSRLYAQHREETGQAFTAKALERAFVLTAGQPWLVNALAREVVEKLEVPLSRPVRPEHVDQASEELIMARATHLDSLVARLTDERVRRVVEPMLAGSFGDAPADVYNDDLQCARDLGLLAPGPGLRIANPIYNEVIVRVLAGTIEDRLPVPEPRSFVLPDGRLDLHHVLAEFAEFWRQHGEVLAGTANWREVAAQLVLMAWLQRIVNGGGYVDREYGIGRGRIDLLLRWPWRDDQGRRQEQREAIELKVWAAGRKDPLAEGLSQLDGYLDRMGLDTGALVIFDRRPEAAEPELRTRFEEVVSPAGRGITLLRG